MKRYVSTVTFLTDTPVAEGGSISAAASKTWSNCAHRFGIICSTIHTQSLFFFRLCHILAKQESQNMSDFTNCREVQSPQSQLRQFQEIGYSLCLLCPHATLRSFCSLLDWQSVVKISSCTSWQTIKDRFGILFNLTLFQVPLWAKISGKSLKLGNDTENNNR